MTPLEHIARVVCPTMVAIWLASMWTMHGLDAGWYDALSKPSWTPPPSAFGLAWGILYPLMTAVEVIAEGRAATADQASAMYMQYLAQLALNAAWCFLFFERGLLGLAAIDLLALNVAVWSWKRQVANTVPFWAQWLGLYQAWIAFAALLSLAIAMLNP